MGSLTCVLPDSLADREALAYSSTDPGVLDALLTGSRYHALRVAVASNPATSEDTLARLACSRYRLVKTAVVGNPSSTDRVLQILAKYLPPRLRYLVAEHPNASTPTLDALFAVYKAGTATNVALVQALAEHPNTPDTVLRTLAVSSFPSVRTRVSENPASPLPAACAAAFMHASLLGLGSNLMASRGSARTAPEARIGAMAAIRAWWTAGGPSDLDLSASASMDAASEAVRMWRRMNAAQRSLAMDLWESLPKDTPGLDVLHAARDLATTNVSGLRTGSVRMYEVYLRNR